jgi:hypothetical protein
MVSPSCSRRDERNAIPSGLRHSPFADPGRTRARMLAFPCAQVEVKLPPSALGAQRLRNGREDGVPIAALDCATPPAQVLDEIANQIGLVHVNDPHSRRYHPSETPQSCKRRGARRGRRVGPSLLPTSWHSGGKKVMHVTKTFRSPSANGVPSAVEPGPSRWGGGDGSRIRSCPRLLWASSPSPAAPLRERPGRRNADGIRFPGCR